MPGLAAAFIDLTRELLVPAWRALNRAIKSLAGPVGLWLANVATVLGLLIAVPQYQLFEQIPDVSIKICGDRYEANTWYQLLRYADKTIALKVAYQERCDFLTEESRVQPICRVESSDQFVAVAQCCPPR